MNDKEAIEKIAQSLCFKTGAWLTVERSKLLAEIIYDAGYRLPPELKVQVAEAVKGILAKMNKRDVGGINPEWAISDKEYQALKGESEFHHVKEGE